jgi:futalosine hydrolase
MAGQWNNVPIMTNILVCTATDLESHLLVAADVPVLVTGVGPVGAAIALTRHLANESVERIVICGVGGAYPSSGLAVGDVACASTETFGDLGAESPGGFLDPEALGLSAPSTFELDLFPAERRVPFVTCSTCTGTDLRAGVLEERTGGSVESMEGAALVQVARTFGVAIGEIRGISNPVGDRDRESWRLAEAATAAQEALLRWLND